MQALGFESGEEALESGVIVGIGRAAHAGQKAVRAQEIAVFGTGILATAFAVVEQARSWTPLVQSHAQSGGRQGGGWTGGKGPADDAATVKIEDDREVKPALGRG